MIESRCAQHVLYLACNEPFRIFPLRFSPPFFPPAAQGNTLAFSPSQWGLMSTWAEECCDDTLHVGAVGAVDNTSLSAAVVSRDRDLADDSQQGHRAWWSLGPAWSEAVTTTSTSSAQRPPSSRRDHSSRDRGGRRDGGGRGGGSRGRSGGRRDGTRSTRGDRPPHQAGRGRGHHPEGHHSRGGVPEDTQRHGNAGGQHAPRQHRQAPRQHAPQSQPQPQVAARNRFADLLDSDV